MVLAWELMYERNMSSKLLNKVVTAYQNKKTLEIPTRLHIEYGGIQFHQVFDM